MIKGILAYLGVFLFTLYWFFMFNDEVMTAALILEIIYFVLSVLYCLITRNKISADLKNVISSAEKNQKVPVRVSVKNKSKIFTIHFCFYFRMENTLTGEKTKVKSVGTVVRKAEKIVSIAVSSNNCGNMVITLEKIKIYDFLMILGIKKKVKNGVQIKILPQLHLLPIEITRKTRDFIADSDEISDSERGDDPSSVFQIREYSEQDSIHDIHWKLSAKSDELWVKERGKALGSAVLIWINTSEQNKRVGKKVKLSYTKKKRRRKRYFLESAFSSDVLELAASLSFSLFEEKCIHTVMWYEPDSGRIRQKRVSREAHIYELLNRMAMIKMGRDEKEIEAEFQEAVRTESFSTIVEIKERGNMLVNGEKIDIPRDKENIQWDKIIFTV